MRYKEPDYLIENLTVTFDPVGNTLKIDGLPGIPSITFPSPEGVVPEVLEKILQNPSEKAKLALVLTGALNGYLSGIKTHQSEVVESEEVLEAPTVPRWARVGIPAFQEDISKFYKFLELDKAENGLIQVMGALISLQSWWKREIVYNELAKNKFDEVFTPAIINKLKEYITFFEKKGVLDNQKAHRYLIQLNGVYTNMQNRQGYSNPIGFLLDDGVVRIGTGFVPRLVRDIVFNNSNRLSKITKTFATVTGNKYIIEKNAVSKSDLLSTDNELQNQGIKDFLEEQFTGINFNYENLGSPEGSINLIKEMIYSAVRNGYVQLELDEDDDDYSKGFKRLNS